METGEKPKSVGISSVSSSAVRPRSLSACHISSVIGDVRENDNGLREKPRVGCRKAIHCESRVEQENKETGNIGMKKGGKIPRDRIFRHSSASECHLLSFAEAEDRDMKKEMRVLRNRSLPSNSASTSLENTGRPSRTIDGPNENNGSRSGRAINGASHRTTMAATEVCAKQLSHLRPQQRNRAIHQLTNTPNWSCDLRAPICELGWTNNKMLKEIITENLFRKAEN